MIPWTEQAILVREFGLGDRRVAGTGELSAIVRRLSRTDRDQWGDYLIDLPERASEPYAFVPFDFQHLVAAIG